MKILFTLLLFFAYLPLYAQDKVLYFTNMGEIANTGKMFFRGRIEPRLLQKIQQEKKYTFTKMYYKVYHRGLPYKVEAYDFQSNRLKSTYWFDKYAVNFQFKKYGKRTINCTNAYAKKKSILTKIERCTNQEQKAIVFDDWRWLYTYYYKNAIVYQKEILKNNKVYRYKNGKQKAIIPYEDADTYPLYRPKLDDYPWR